MTLLTWLNHSHFVWLFIGLRENTSFSREGKNTKYNNNMDSTLFLFHNSQLILDAQQLSSHIELFNYIFHNKVQLSFSQII